jgi:pimeloyl-ACP methyl ester carboxylesterase
MPNLSRQRLRLSGGGDLSFIVAGEPSKPAVLLLHGFPNAARMFEEVMTALSDTAYLIAPDLPGSGESDPLPSASFPAFGQAISELLDHLAIGPRYVYLHDWGAPVGFHIAMQAPGKVLGLIIQNANAHHTGFSPLWDQSEAYWANPTPENEATVNAVLTLKGIRDQYVMGVPEEVAARIPATEWEEDWRVMNLPGRMDTQRALLFEYGHYVARFGELTAYLKKDQPPALLLWGRHDAFFDIAETVSWMQDLPRMEAHVLDAGHLLLETHSAQAAPLMREFIRRTESARKTA